MGETAQGLQWVIIDNLVFIDSPMKMIGQDFDFFNFLIFLNFYFLFLDFLFIFLFLEFLSFF